MDIAPDYSGNLQIVPNDYWVVSALFADREQNIWTKGDNHITIAVDSGAFVHIAKLVNGSTTMYIGIEKPISVNTGIYDDSTCHLTGELEKDAILTVMYMKIENVFHNAGDGDLLVYDAATIKIDKNADSFDAIIKLKNTHTGRIQYIGISRAY